MSDELEALRMRLETMPEIDRAVFERARFDGLDFPTIAASLGVEVGEVERRMTSAMRHLLG